MEKEQWIEKVLNSTTGMTAVVPNDDLLNNIRNKINQQSKVSPAAVWLVAASIAALIAVNVVLLHKNANQKNNQEVYLENTLNQSNQLYQ